MSGTYRRAGEYLAAGGLYPPPPPPESESPPCPFVVIVCPFEPTELWFLGSLCIIFPFLGGGVCAGSCTCGVQATA